MDDYIKRQAAKRLFADGHDYGLARRLDEIPAADVVERRRGEWVYSADGTPHCSECGVEVEPERISRFCPDCGARLDGD